MNIPKEIYHKFSSHRTALFFIYLLFMADDDGGVSVTIRQMAKDNEVSTWKVSKMLEELKTLGACQTSYQTKTKQVTKQNSCNISICKYEFYKKTFSTEQTSYQTKTKQVTKQKRNKISHDLSFVDEAYLDVFERWLDYKKGRKESYKTESSVRLCYDKLVSMSGHSPLKAKEIVEQSMANNWAGLFDLKEQRSSGIIYHADEMDYNKNEDWD